MAGKGRIGWKSGHSKLAGKGENGVKCGIGRKIGNGREKGELAGKGESPFGLNCFGLNGEK